MQRDCRQGDAFARNNGWEARRGARGGRGAGHLPALFLASVGGWSGHCAGTMSA